MYFNDLNLNPQYLCNPQGGLSPHAEIEALQVRASAQNIWNGLQ